MKKCITIRLLPTRIISNLIFTMILILFAICYFFPLLWLFLTSFKDPALIGTGKFFFTPSLYNYKIIFTNWNIMLYFKNSVIVSVLSTLIALTVGSLGAYSLVRLNPPNKDFLAFEILSLRGIPPVVAVIPIFILVNKFQIQGSLFTLTIIYAVMNLPFVIWLIAGFIKEIPLSVEESALIDGCTRFEIFRKICFPLIVPGVVSTGILSLIFAWNEFLFANILMSKDAKTLPVIAAMAVKEYSIAWGPACAAGVVCIFPIIFLGIIVQKYLVRGFSFGAIK